MIAEAKALISQVGDGVDRAVDAACVALFRGVGWIEAKVKR